MSDARALVAEMRAALEPLDRRLAGHPYLAALEEGRIAKEKLRLVAGEQHHIIASDLRSIALLLNRHAHLPSRDYLLDLLPGAVAASEALPAFAAAVGASGDGLAAYEPLAGCQAYPAYVAWLALYGTDADFAAAFLVNLPTWGALCERMSAALRGAYGLAPEAVAFFDLFAAPQPEFEAGSLRVIQAGLDRGVDAASVGRAARMIQAYELMYWDALYEASA